MSDVIRVWVGFDPREAVAYHVAAHSIISRSSLPVTVGPVGNTVLPKSIWSRQRGPYDSTEFSNARFMVPYLAGYQGWAMFMDCDMLCLEDIAELWACRDESKAVMVRKHHHEPRYDTKFLGQPQTTYSRKNWSSLMLLNASHPVVRALDPEHVANAAGLDLHGFAWCPDSLIGDLPKGWNCLIEHGKPYAGRPKLAHFTQGGPWHGYLNQPFADDWADEVAQLLDGDNPRAHVTYTMSVTRSHLILNAGYLKEQGDA